VNISWWRDVCGGFLWPSLQDAANDARALAARCAGTGAVKQRRGVRRSAKRASSNGISVMALQRRYFFSLAMCPATRQTHFSTTNCLPKCGAPLRLLADTTCRLHHSRVSALSTACSLGILQGCRAFSQRFLEPLPAACSLSPLGLRLACRRGLLDSLCISPYTFLSRCGAVPRLAILMGGGTTGVSRVWRSSDGGGGGGARRRCLAYRCSPASCYSRRSGDLGDGGRRNSDNISDETNALGALRYGAATLRTWWGYAGRGGGPRRHWNGPERRQTYAVCGSGTKSLRRWRRACRRFFAGGRFAKPACGRLRAAVASFSHLLLFTGRGRRLCVGGGRRVGAFIRLFIQRPILFMRFFCHIPKAALLLLAA